MAFWTDDFGFLLNVHTSTLTYLGSINNGHRDYASSHGSGSPYRLCTLCSYGVFSFMIIPAVWLDFVCVSRPSFRFVLFSLFMLLTYYTKKHHKFIFLFSTSKQADFPYNIGTYMVELDERDIFLICIPTLRPQTLCRPTSSVPKAILPQIL